MSASAMPVVRGASACLVDDEGRVLLIAREKEPFRGALAFPGGRIEAGESGRTAAGRELYEETGYRVGGEPMAHVVVENVHGGTRFRIESFAFTEWTAPESEPSNAVIWLDFESALRSTLAPGMEDALTAFERAFAAKR